MNINRFFVNCGTSAVLITCLLSASALRAQTFAGQAELTELPAQLEATVYPLAELPSTIKVIFNNMAGGQVRVMIRDEKGKVFYSELESIARYRRRFDLSSLPEGHYMVELSKQNEHYAQAFVIEMPTTSHITMGTRPARKLPEPPVNKKLIVSQ